MQIYNRLVLDKLVKKHPKAREIVARWVKTVELARWKNIIDVKQTFNSADYVRGLFVFNLGGNNFRILAAVLFEESEVTIIKAGTHTEYDNWRITK